MKNFTARFTALCLFLALLAGCGEASSGETTGTAAPEVTTQSVEDILGFAQEDNGGKEFNMLVAATKSYEFDVPEATGDIVEDAIYAKNRAVEDYLGISLNFRVESCSWDERSVFMNLIIQDVMSGSKEYDMVSSVTVSTIAAASEGIYIDGKSLPFCDFSKPWWIADMYDHFSVAGKLYGFIGDASLSLYKDMTVMFFNKRIWDEFKQPNPYDLVRNNEWTLDKMIELTAGMAADLNGDGAYDMENDQLAYLGERVPSGTFQTSLNLKVVEIDGDGMPVVLGLTEKYVDAYDKMRRFFENPGVLKSNSVDTKTYLSMLTFGEGRVATMNNFLYSTEYLRDMKDDYGILPMPKYDENQDKYISQIGTSTTMLFVPVTTSDVALTSKVMEAFAYYTQQMVVPKYYEIALKEKYARDDDIAEMLDIIRDGAAFDFVYVYGAGCLTNPPNLYFAYDPMHDDIASTFAAHEASFKASLEELIKKYEAIEN